MHATNQFLRNSNCFRFKSNLASPTFTELFLELIKRWLDLEIMDNTSDANKPVSGNSNSFELKANLKACQHLQELFLELIKAMVGLSNVDNTSDANKPVSAAAQTALDLKTNLASPTFTGTVSGIDKTMVIIVECRCSDATNQKQLLKTALDLKQI
jgi:hypothetical protein